MTTCCHTKNTAINLLLVLISIIVGIVVVDVSFRIFAKVAPRSGAFSPRAKRSNLSPITSVLEHNYSGILQSRDFEVSVHANELGFRDRNFEETSPSVEKPYFITGDSYLFGWGVEVKERMGEQFHKLLISESPSLAAPVMNLSFPGFGTSQYYDVIKMFATKHHPRLIVIGFFVGNDFIDDQNTLLAQQSYREGRTPPFLQYMTDERITLRSVLKTSPLFNLFQCTMWRFTWFRDTFNRMEIRSDRLILFDQEETLRQKELYAESFRQLDKITHFSRKSNIPLLVMLLPDHLQVLSKEIFKDFDIEKPQRRIKNHLDKLGVYSLDLLPYFNNIKDPGSLFFREDKHWSVTGNAFVAKVLADFIVTHKNSIFASTGN